jgi:hypothetical protein
MFEAAFGDFQQQIDNPALRAEEIECLEGSLIWNPTPRLSLQAYTFRSTLEGLIQGSSIDSVDQIQGDVVGPSGDPEDLVGLLQYQSGGDVRSSGAGGSLRYRGTLLRAYLNLAYAQGELEGSDGSVTQLPAVSSWLASGGFSYRTGDWTTSVSARYVGSQPVEASFIEHPLYDQGTAGDFVEANMRFIYSTFLVYPVSFRLDVRNLFKSEGYVSASTVYAIPRLPIPGRSLVLGVEVRF